MNTVCCNNSFIFEKQQNRHWPVILQHFLYLPPLYMGVILAVFISSRCSSELAQLVPLPFSQGRSARYSDRLHDFSVTIPRCYKDVYVNSFFPRKTTPWNSLRRLLVFVLVFPKNCACAHIWQAKQK